MTTLPKEILSLAIGRRIPTLPVIASAARDLCTITSGPAWEPIPWFGRRDSLLRGAWLRHDWRSGCPPLAVGRVGRYDRAAGAYYIAVDGEVLQHAGRPLLFGDRHRAMRAASLGAFVLCAQHLSRLFVEMVARAHELTEADLHPFDQAMKCYRGAVHVAAPEWVGQSIALTIPESLGAQGRRMIAGLLALKPAVTRTVQ